MRSRTPLSLLVTLVLVAAGAVAAPATAHAATADEYAATIAKLVNQARKDAGRAPLTVSVSLSAVAERWSERMADTGTFDHNPSYFSQYPAGARSGGENIAWGGRSSGQYPASEIHKGLMSSSGHKANILKKDFTHLGVGVAFVKRGGYNRVYVTQNFARYTSVGPDSSPARSAERLSGASRYGTAVAIGREAFPSSDEVVLVAGAQSSVVDGLVAAPFARARKAPVLLSEKGRLGDETRAEVKRRSPDRAWLVGGRGVLGDGVVTELKKLGVRDVVRLAGDSRYGTAAAVAKRMPAHTKAIVASGADANLIDAAAVSGPAAASGRPILLTDPRRLPGETAAVLRSRGTRHVTVVGGTGAVSGDVKGHLARTMSVTRVGGSDRFSTAAKVASSFVHATGTNRAVVAGAADANLIDAMTGGVLAEPILLTGRTAASATAQWVADNRVSHLVVVGGTGSVPKDAVYSLKNAR